MREDRSGNEDGGMTLADLLARVHHLLTEPFHDTLRGHGLTVTEWRVLAALWARDGATMTELAALLLFKQPTLPMAVDRLVSAGLVQRRTPDEDRRRTLVHITGPGRERVAPLVVLARQHEAAMRHRVGAEESRRLAGALEAVIARLAPAAQGGGEAYAGLKPRRRARPANQPREPVVRAADATRGETA
jgi:DNA-binding MarR family transcriptional regulator